MNVDLLITHASQLLTIPAHNHGPQRGQHLGDLGSIDDGAIAINGTAIVDVGPASDLLLRHQGKQTIDANHQVVMPGFVDPHTHVVFAGDRANEFERRIAGATYMEIMNAGGGIMSTVRNTRAASLDQLMAETRSRLDRMLIHGTTTAEAKTGYGLETIAELKMLEAILKLDQEHSLDLVPTFLGAHAIPAEYKGREDAYTAWVIDEMLPAAYSRWQLAEDNASTIRHPALFADVFCEDGAFTLNQTRKILTRAKELGFALKIHVDEFEPLHGTRLGVELGAISVDHVVSTPADEVELLGRSSTMAIGLPGTPFGLAQKDYTPAKKILKAGGALAIATDLNPGTSWCESMQVMIALACRYMKLTQAQAIAAATINAAYAIGRGDSIGSLEIGKQADVLIMSVSDYQSIGYRYGTNLVQTVIKRGKIVYADGRLV
ncbi:MAG TPA: imidazolonepropionase [Anaerolineae bacterium]|nr:imidazolonepropionase [Anaerolineae bacterium]